MASNALQFGGAQARVECGSAAEIDDLHAGVFTISLWIRYNGSAGNVWHKGGSATGWLIDSVGNDFRFIPQRATTDGQLYSYNNNPLPDATWAFAALVWDPNDIDNCKLYFGDENNDATEVASYFGKTIGSGAASSDAADQMRIGVNASSVSGDLRLAYAHIYSGARSLAELIAQQFAPQVIASTIRLFDLGAGGAAVAPDLSTYAADGTLAGTALPTWVAGPANVTPPGGGGGGPPVSPGLFR